MTILRIPMTEYLADPCSAPSLNSSTARTLVTRSPLHAWHDHPLLGGAVRPSTKAADIGTVAHDMLLGGEGKICVIDPKDYPAKTTGAIPKGWTNDAIKAAAETARANSITPLLPWEMAAAEAMAKAARKFIASSEHPAIFEDGESELTVIAATGETLTRLRCRPDWMSGRYVLHYKTTQASAEPETFARGIMRSMGYDFSMVFYRRVIELALGAGREHLMLVQEQNPPYACSLLNLSAAKEQVIMPKVEQAIELWSQCLASGKWPGYPGAVHTVEPQLWELEEVEVSYGD
jgi:hypothetical protein